VLLVTTLILLAAHTILPGQRYLVVTSLPAGEYVVAGCGQTSQVETASGQANLKALGRPTYVRP
jgi:hypothetical protein